MSIQYNTIENVAIASFETSLKNDSANQPIKSIVAEITPTQDLHGYEYPWPRNGGKNRIVNNLTESWVLGGLTMTPNTDGSITVEIPDDITTTKMVAANTAIYNGGTAANQNTEEKILKNGTYKIVFVDDSSNNFLLQVYGSNSSGVSDISQIVSASSGTFTIDDSFAYNWVRIITKSSVPAGTYTIKPMILDASETDLTWEPQQNICPINGWTGGIVSVQGKNFFVNRISQKVIGAYSEVTPKDDGSYSVKITGTPSSIAICINNTAMANGGTSQTQNYGKKTIPSGQYKLFFDGDAPSQFRIQIVGSNNPSGNTGSNVFYSKNTGTVVIDDTYAYNWIRISVGAGLPTGDYILKPTILRQDDTDLTWTKYVGDSYPVSWQTEAGAVYGGTVDIISGVLTIEKVYKNLSAMDWKLYSSASKPVFFANNADGRIFAPNEESGILCDTYQAYPYATTAVGFVDTGISPGISQAQDFAGRLLIIDERFETLEDFKAGVGGNVVYKLATPQTYQLSSQQIKTLLWVNNVWADTGEINSLTWQYSVFDLLQVFINGFEITDLIAFGGWERERNDVDGPEAGRTLDARMHRARVATKMRYNVTCRPMLAGELASLERLIMPEYVTVKVIGDPYYGTWERTCYVNNTSAKYLIRKRSGAQWWGGITFPIIEV